MGEQAFGQSGRVGSVLKDKWRIDAKLAQGGVATVFAATHKNGSRVAVKILHPEFTRNPDVRARFLREGYAANTVGHPGVVQVLYDDVTEDGAAFIVMELLEGELLEGRRMRLGGRLPLPEVVDFGAQLLSVLESAHEKSIIHRDIKPENLWVLPDGTLKVLDFGVAQMRQALGTMDRTATGMLLGTPEFMPPEQVMGFQDQVDAQSDLWAAGATLFVLASGQNPHAAETISQFLIAAASQPARTLGAVAPWVPPPLCAVIDRALAFDKANRWRSASEMRAALETVGRSVLGAAAPSGARRAAPQRPPPEPEPEDEILEIDDVVPSAPDDDERTIAGPGVMSGLGARTAPPPSMPPDSGMGGEGPTRIGAAPLGVLAQATRGGGIDPFDVTTLASGEMLRREDLDAALPADDDEHDADERTITDLAPRGVGTDPPPGFAELGAPPRPNTALDRRPAGPPPKIPPPAPSSQGKPPPPPVPPRPARPRQPSVPDFGSIPPVPTDLGAGFDFGAPQSPPASFRPPNPSVPEFATSAGIPGTSALVGTLGAAPGPASGPPFAGPPPGHAPGPPSYTPQNGAPSLSLPPMRPSMASYPQQAMPPSAGPYASGGYPADPAGFGPDPGYGPMSQQPYSMPHSAPLHPHAHLGPHSVGSHPGGPVPVGPHSVGPHSVGPHSVGPHSAGPHSAGPHPGGFGGGPHAVGPMSQMQTQRRQQPPTMMVRPRSPKTMYILAGVGAAFVAVWLLLFAAWQLSKPAAPKKPAAGQVR